MELPPQLVSVGTFLAFCGFIYKLFEKGDDLINDDAKQQLKSWILRLKPTEKMQNWPSTFAHWFDRVFGEKHLSWRCFFRSCLASLVAVVLVTLVWAALRPQELRLILKGFWLAPSMLKLTQNILFYFLVLNLLPDYVSLLETRYMIKLMAKSNSVIRHITLLVLDAVVTMFIAAVLPLLLALFSVSMVSAQPISLQTYLAEVLPLTSNSLIIGFGAPFLAICFYTAFLTSVWIWLYALSAVLLKVLALWEFAKSKVRLEEKPLTYLGVIAISFVTAGYISISVLPVPGDRTVANRQNFEDLRSDGVELSVEDVSEMIRIYGYYDVFMNVRGTGIDNTFVLMHGDSVVFDSTTGLFWQQSGSDNRMTFEEAKGYVHGLNAQNYADYRDWRLPTMEEAMSLMEPIQNGDGLFIDSLFNSKQSWIWTADKYSSSYRIAHWAVFFDYGGCDYYLVIYDELYSVRAVR